MGGWPAWKHEENKKDLQPVTVPKGSVRADLQRNNRWAVWYLSKVPESASQWQRNNSNHLFGYRSYQTEEGWTGNKWILYDLRPRGKTQQLRFDQENIRQKCRSWLKDTFILTSLINFNCST